MTCEEMDPLFDADLDGSLSAEERRALEAHLAGCDECREALVRLRQLQQASRALPREIDPARDLWTGIAPRLAPRDIPTRARTPWYRSSAALAVAALFLLVAGVGLGVTISRRTAPQPDLAFATDRARYAAAAAQLAEELAADPALLALSARSIITQDLDILDRAIREAETALAADPGNTALEQIVLARERQRVDLLERALRAGRQES